MLAQVVPMRPQPVLVATGVLAAALVVDARDAAACGGCFPPQGEQQSVVTDHRMIFAVSKEQTTPIEKEVVGPHETVQLQSENANALNEWRAVIAQYVTEKLDFLALEPKPGAGARGEQSVGSQRKAFVRARRAKRVVSNTGGQS